MKTDQVNRGLNIVELPRQRQNSGNGYTTTRTFKGTRSSILEYQDILDNQGYSTSTTEGPLWTLTATIGTDLENDDNYLSREPGDPTSWMQVIDWEVEPISGNWSIGVRYEEKDLLESQQVPIVVDLRDNDPKMLAAIKEWNENGPKDSHPAYAFTYEDTANETANKQRAEKIYQLLNEGVKTKSVSVPIARVQFTVPKKITKLSTYFAKDNQILSWESMVDEPMMESWVMKVLYEFAETESSYQYEQDGSPIDGSSNAPVTIGKSFGWRKRVNAESGANNTLNVSVEYEFGLWADDVWGLPN